MLGEANLQVMNIYTNNDEVNDKLKALNLNNLVFKRNVVYNDEGQKISNQFKELMRGIIPYENKCDVGNRHYLEELAISQLNYRTELCKGRETININVIDTTVDKINLKEIYTVKGGITFVTGTELTKTYLGKVAKGEGIMINIPSVNECIECIKYFYYLFNSIHYFKEEFMDILLKSKGKCITNVVVSNEAKDIIKYLNFEYEDKHNGTFISIYKGKCLNKFGEYMEKLEKNLYIGECNLYCNEYYNCETNEEYYLGFVI